ncbi:MAG: dehydrogenase, partial [Methanosarcinales archaeon]|nr:dehydrogenase [Methanosarcinales archaeon]
MVNKHDVKKRMRQLAAEYIHEPQQEAYKLDDTEMMLHIGPQNPIQPGPFLIDLKLSGETVRDSKLYMGYGHKGIEKILESMTYIQGLPVTDRICYLASLSNNEAYVSSVERLLDIEPPERSQYIRVIMQELSRIQSHLLGTGEYATDLGFVTMFLFMIREREYVLGLIEDITGARITHCFPRFGGVREDLPEGWREKAIDVLSMVNEKCEMYKELFASDRTYRMRTVGVGVLTKEDVMKAGLTGPALRASGIDY